MLRLDAVSEHRQLPPFPGCEGQLLGGDPLEDRLQRQALARKCRKLADAVSDGPRDQLMSLAAEYEQPALSSDRTILPPKSLRNRHGPDARRLCPLG